MSMTLAQYRTEVSSILGLDNSSSGDQPLIDQWLNEGVTDFLLRTHCNAQTGSISLTAGTGDYPSAALGLAVLEAWISTSSQDYRIERVGPAEILSLRINSSSSSPALRYAVAGANMLMLYPAPATNDTFKFINIPSPTALSATADSPTTIPGEWHRAVTYYALWRGADLDDDQSSQQGERYRGLYEDAIRQARRAQVYKGGSRMARGKVAPRRRRRWLSVHNPSTDTG